MTDIEEYVRNPVFNELSEHVIETYQVKPVFEYSRCTWPGWNIKYKKSGKSLCTIYPFEGYIWVLIVVGQKEKAHFERMLPFLGSYIRQLYAETEEGMGQRWLKIELEDSANLEYVKHCIDIRRRPEGRKKSQETEKGGNDMGELKTLPNIGPDTERQLHEVGIHTGQELKEIGAEQAWLKLQQIDESACMNRLLGLEGAIQGIKKTLISDERKAELKEFYKWNKLK